MRSCWFVALVVLVGCAADPSPGPPPGDDPEDPSIIDVDFPADTAAGDDRDLDDPRDGMLAACEAQCDAMAAAELCTDTAALAAEVAACRAACPEWSTSLDDRCVELQRAAWECLAVSAWSCFGGTTPNVEAETCAAERAAADDCRYF